MNKNNFWYRFIVICCLTVIGFFSLLTSSAEAHSDDLSVAQFFIEDKTTQVNLAFPSSLFGFADDNLDNQISATEIIKHQSSLTEFIANNLVLTNNGIKGKLTVKPSPKSSLPYIINDRSYSHSQILLEYNWENAIDDFTIKYNLFPQNFFTAHCIASIFHHHQTDNYIFNQQNRLYSLNNHNSWGLSSQNFLITLIIAFVWGSLHALSPGHGKSMVVAYLVSSKATTKHAIFLGLMTTATHTLGIFALAVATLLLSKYILPEQLYPFLQLISGLSIIIVAVFLFKKRVINLGKKDKLDQNNQDHDHRHHHHELSTENESKKIEWKSLISIGISSGLVPCPAALILLLGTITVGNISLGIILLLLFSLGLALTLITIGILSVKAQTLLEKIPEQINITQKLAVIAPVFIFLVGLLMTYQALNQLPLII